MFSGIRRISTKTNSHRWFSNAISANPKTLVGTFGSTRIVLAGKVMKDPYIFENGKQSFLFRTEDEEYGYSVNRVHVGKNVSVAAGQSLHVVGHLQSREFVNEHGHKRFEIVANARTITSIATNYSDINAVEITGAVLTELRTLGDKFSDFRVKTTVLPKSNTELAIPLVFQVRIYDHKLCDSIREDFQANPTVRLLGSLQSEEEFDSYAKRKRSGFISASSIMIISSRKKAHADSTRDYI